MTALHDMLRREAGGDIPEAVRAFAAQLASKPGVAAVLFYGSSLRTGDLSGVLDFYVLTGAPHRTGLRGWVESWLWPEIAFETCEATSGERLQAKVATLPLAVFRRAAEGRTLDTTIWTRFVQPCRLLHARDPATSAQVLDALVAATVTAGRFAAVLGPASGLSETYWAALFRQTYAAEFRVEAPGREHQVLEAAPDRYDALLPLAWEAGSVPFDDASGMLTPRLAPDAAARLLRAWRLRRRLGKPLNAARLFKAALTASGAARYAAGKLARHTDVEAELTPWRERRPVLAAFGVLWRLRKRQADAR